MPLRSSVGRPSRCRHAACGQWWQPERRGGTTMASTDDTAIPAPARDADSWARHTGPLSVGSTPEGALNLNVEGRQLASPMQGFGKLWQKTYRVALDGADLAPAEVIAVWKANYGTFWPEGN